MINVPDYWPFPAEGKRLTNTFDNGLVLEYYHDFNTPGGPGIRLHQSQYGKWQCDWLYRADPMRGVLEFGDVYPAPWWLFWSHTKDEIMQSGKEIIWGYRQNIGDVIQGQCAIAWPYTLWGWQMVTFLNLLPTFTVAAGTFTDVLVIQYAQSWTNAKDILGATMYLAKGLGQIKTIWETNSVPTGFGMTLQHSTLT
jgi:hypothetical protein